MDFVENCIGVITVELLSVVVNAPYLDHKESHIHTFLDKFFADIDLTESFNRTQTLLYDEVLSVEILLSLNSWFNKQSCNINNIRLVTTHTLGLEKWFNDYVKLFGISGFRVQELPLVSSRYNTRLNSLKKTKFESRSFNNYFTLYSGTRNSFESDFIAGLFLNLEDKGLIDYIGQFTSNKVLLENYLEEITGFKNKDLVDTILSKSYKIFDTTNKIKNEPFDNSGFQFLQDRNAPLQIVRETANFTPWVTITEKTLRPFLHRQMPILLSGVSSVSLLESYGFKFDYQLINHNDYQYINNFPHRCIKVHDLVKSVIETHQLCTLEQHYIDCEEIIDYNYNYIISKQFFKTVEEKFIKNSINE